VASMEENLPRVAVALPAVGPARPRSARSSRGAIGREETTSGLLVRALCRGVERCNCRRMLEPTSPTSSTNATTPSHPGVADGWAPNALVFAVVASILLGPMLVLFVHRARQAKPAPQETVTDLLTRSRAFLDHEDAGNALPLLERARVLAPANAAVFNDLCVSHGILRDRAKAVAACRRALELEPSAQLTKNNLRWVESLPEQGAP